MVLRYLVPVAVMSVAVVFAAENPAELTPVEVIEQTAGDLLDALNGRREELAENPAEIKTLVNSILLPNFDTRYTARWILAAHWNDATVEQRERFRDGLYQNILRTYASGLLEFTANKLTVYPYRGSLEGKKSAKVKTEIILDDGKTVPVNYRLRRTKNGWKVWDVEIEGISYAKTYRTDFDAEIKANGLDAVILRLEGDQKTDAPEAQTTAQAD